MFHQANVHAVYEALSLRDGNGYELHHLQYGHSLFERAQGHGLWTQGPIRQLHFVVETKPDYYVWKAEA